MAKRRHNRAFIPKENDNEKGTEARGPPRDGGGNKCGRCNRQFHNPTSLKWHIDKNVCYHPCSDCGSDFVRSKSLDIHKEKCQKGRKLLDVYNLNRTRICFSTIWQQA